MMSSTMFSQIWLARGRLLSLL